MILSLVIFLKHKREQSIRMITECFGNFTLISFTQDSMESILVRYNYLFTKFLILMTCNGFNYLFTKCLSLMTWNGFKYCYADDAQVLFLLTYLPIFTPSTFLSKIQYHMHWNKLFFNVSKPDLLVVHIPSATENYNVLLLFTHCTKGWGSIFLHFIIWSAYLTHVLSPPFNSISHLKFMYFFMISPVQQEPD